MSQSGRIQKLTAALRAAATRAAALEEGGFALVFAAAPGDESDNSCSRLRAAAGFASPEDAREAADSLRTSVCEALEEGTARTQAAPASLAALSAARIAVVPLASDERPLGALVASDSGSSDTPSAGLLELASSTAIQIDYAQLAEELEGLRMSAADSQQQAHEKSDELLKLSEALFAQDIELLRNNEKLGKIEKLKNDFIEKMSRELRTPLNSIIESTISVLAGENESLSESAKESLRSVLDEGTAFQRTLQNILDLWRIKQAELPVELQEVNFEEVVDEAIFSVQETLEGKQVAIEKHFEQSLPRICTDLAKANQVLFLLLDNAAKFTTEGTITISAHVAGGQLICSVADTGIGICPDDQPLIYDDFFQVDDLMSTRYRGAGLGLTLAKDLLVLLEGDISLQSEVGKGTVFTFQIPVQTLATA